MVTTKKSWRLTHESHWILAMSTIDCTMSCVILFRDLMNYTNCSFNDLSFVRMDQQAEMRMQGHGFIRHSLLETKCFLDTIFKDKEF